MIRSKLNPAAPEFRPVSAQTNKITVGAGDYTNLYSAQFNISKKTTFNMTAAATIGKEILQLQIINEKTGEIIHDECFSRGKINIHFVCEKNVNLKIRGRCILHGGTCQIEKIKVAVL